MTLFVLLCALLGVTAQEVTPPDGDKKPAKVEGRTVNAVTGAPVRKAKLILVTRGEGSHALSETSDAEGRFVFEKLEAGTYYLRAEKTGFLEQEYDSASARGFGTPLTVAPGQELKDLVFKLTPQGVITGKVLDDEGEPVGAHAMVSVLRLTALRAKAQMISGEVTNDLGEFRIANLAPGRYVISVGFIEGSRVDSRPKKDEPEEALVQTFYSSAPDLAGAVPVEIKAGQEVTGIDIMLRKARVYRVLGNVTGLAAGQAAQRMSVVLAGRKREPGTSPMANGRIKADGSFEIENVQPGAYELMLYQDGDRGQEVVGRVAVDVGTSNVKGVVVPLLELLKIGGVVRVESDEKLSVDRAFVALSQTGGLPFGYRPASIGADGTFTIPGVTPGRYNVHINGLPETYYVKSVRAGKQEMGDDGLDLGDATALEVVLGTKPGTVEGSVQRDKKPAAGTLVMLVPDPPRPAQRYLTRYANADQNGRYSMKGVAPGKYSTYAWERGLEMDAPLDADSLKAFERKAVKVTVEEGATAQADLTPLKPEDAEPGN
jgi:hypothetical protein